ncbi:MAG: heat-inducible transcriptional repressor HrcA [bacterium]|nr:heat-inducible transcriptional repressor HrcA [bacterium]
MASAWLTYRENSIFGCLVKNFVRTASPIGSAFLAQTIQSSISPATIRNVLMNLEDKGLVLQPYTSAGRIPTDEGYRYYVNDLMKVEKLTPTEKHIIDQYLRKIHNEDVQTILDKACDLLSEISDQLGVVLSPQFFQGKFKRLELISLSDEKLLVVISISSEIVRTIMMELKFQIPAYKIQETERILNERLSGLTLKEIKDSIKVRMSNVNYGEPKLINQFTEKADEIFTFDNDSLHFKGTSKILKQPEFANQERLIKILQLIDNQDILVHIIKSSTKKDDRFSITIGREHSEEMLKNCSLVSTAFQIGEISGTIAVIGPTRMKYEKIVGVLDYVAKAINKLFS